MVQPYKAAEYNHQNTVGMTLQIDEQTPVMVFPTKNEQSQLGMSQKGMNFKEKDAPFKEGRNLQSKTSE